MTEIATQYVGGNDAGYSTAKIHGGAVTPCPFEEERERERKSGQEEEGIRATVTVEVVSEKAREGENVCHDRWKVGRRHLRDASITRARKEREVLGML